MINTGIQFDPPVGDEYPLLDKTIGAVREPKPYNFKEDAQLGFLYYNTNDR